MTIEHSRYMCPDCNKPLSKELHGDEVFLACPWGVCVNEAASEGASGKTEKEAYDKLVASAEAEMDEKWSKS